MADSAATTELPVIVVGTPSGGSAPDEFQQTISRIEASSRGRFSMARVNCQGSSIAHNQNNIVKAARQLSAQLIADGHRPVDAIFFIENDESFRNAEEVIERLWNHGKDIVGCTYAFKFHDRVRVMGVETSGEPIDWLSLYHREPLSQVLALPIGALMVRMNVFDAMDAQIVPSFDEKGNKVESASMPIFYHDVHYGLRLVRTTDYVFCCRARELGFEVWLDAPLSLEIEHWGKYPYGLPHPEAVTRQIATLQAVADAHAKASEEAGAPPHYQQMAEDLYAVAADMVRLRGVFAFKAGPRTDGLEPQETVLNP